LLDGKRVLLFPSIAAKSEFVTKPTVSARSKVSKTPSFASRSEALTITAFDKLLDWLSPDRAKAAEKYEQIRRRLIRVFVSRGANEAEDLADATIERVTNRIEQIAENYVGDPAKYFYKLAQYVYLEYARKSVSPKLSPVPVPTEIPSVEFDTFESETSELQHRCLSRCLETLSSYDRELVLQYYSGVRQAKIDSRKQMSERLQTSLSELRVRVFRIRKSLRQCIERCMSEQSF
jgi:RNA polymerase sigma factor (sigma-70 family)